MAKERHKENDYIYASAYLRCREKYLLSQEGAERMLDSRTPEDAIKILRELDYGGGSDEELVLGFEALLSGEMEKTHKMILSLSADESFFVIFLYPNDYHNIKTLLKAEFLGITADEFLVDAGSIPAASLKGWILSRNYSVMRPEMAKGVQEAIEAYGKAKDPQAVDLVLDQVCFRDINASIAGLKNDFVKGYLVLKADVTNLKSYVRAKEMEKSWSFFSRIFVEGGRVPESVYTKDYDMAPEKLAEKLGAYGLQKVLQEGAAMLRETARFTVLEKLCDNLLMEYIRSARFICAGPEILFAYLAAKESEIKNVRIILAGKLADLPPEQIRERMRKTYA